ncbi:hypothetical protein Leryth_001831 [Lithospermum erythrorhizon]|nr:hypothetical protein Leryth_001831 [Lithospermum erythrorhizon]
MWKLTLFLSIVWAVTILYGEMFAFWLPSVFTCSWPHLQNMVNGTNPGDYVKVAVVTDPQVSILSSLLGHQTRYKKEMDNTV